MEVYHILNKESIGHKEWFGQWKEAQYDRENLVILVPVESGIPDDSQVYPLILLL